MRSSKLPGKKYQELVKHFPLFELKSEKDMDAAVAAISRLYELPSLDADEKTYLEALSVFIERYQNRVHPHNFEKMTPLQALKSLLEDNGLIQVDLARILRISSGRASDIYLGKRDLSKEHIVLLSERFKVSANLFLPQPRRALQSAVAETPASFADCQTQGRKVAKAGAGSAREKISASKPVAKAKASKLSS